MAFRRVSVLRLVLERVYSHTIRALYPRCFGTVAYVATAVLLQQAPRPTIRGKNANVASARSHKEGSERDFQKGDKFSGPKLATLDRNKKQIISIPVTAFDNSVIFTCSLVKIRSLPLVSYSSL